MYRLFNNLLSRACNTRIKVKDELQNTFDSSLNLLRATFVISNLQMKWTLFFDENHVLFELYILRFIIHIHR